MKRPNVSPHVLQAVGVIVLAAILGLGIARGQVASHPPHSLPGSQPAPQPARPLVQGQPLPTYVYNGAIQASRIETESIVIRHPRSRYTMTLGSSEQGSRITIADGTGRSLVLTVDDREGGLLLYSAGGRHRIGLGQVGDEPPLLAIDVPDAGWTVVGRRGVIPGRAPALQAGPEPEPAPAKP